MMDKSWYILMIITLISLWLGFIIGYLINNPIIQFNTYFNNGSIPSNITIDVGNNIVNKMNTTYIIPSHKQVDAYCKKLGYTYGTLSSLICDGSIDCVTLMDNGRSSTYRCIRYEVS
jgi:hypothetical protein